MNSSTETRTEPDAGLQADTLAARLALCGSPANDEPVLDPAYYTDTHGFKDVLLSVDHWNADAAYIEQSHAWQRCMLYGTSAGGGSAN